MSPTEPPPGSRSASRADDDRIGRQDARELATELAALIGQQATPPLLDSGQAAAILNVPQSWIAAEARAGRIPHVRLGRYVRFSRDELIAWCDGRSVGPRIKHRRAA
jgi:excisionase family DNA binding protein